MTGKIWDDSDVQTDEKMPAKADPARVKRWKDNLDLGRAFVKRHDYKEAKKLLRMSLREAEKIGQVSWQYYETLNELGRLAKHGGGSTEDISQILKKRCTNVEAAFTAEPRKRAFHLMVLARYFNDLEQYEQAGTLLAESMTLFKHLLQDGNPVVSLFEVSVAAYNLGFSLGEQRRWEEAERFFRQSAELQEQYLGDEHPDLVKGLNYWMRCLHHLGRHTEEASIRARLAVIRGGYDPRSA